VSNSLAIAAVTATLRNLLAQGLGADPGMAGASVTTLPPDKARDGVNVNQVNVFLYLTMPDAALRNLTPWYEARSGETASPPLPLTLHYVITAYGQDNDDVLGHRALGAAMAALHDHPVLGAAELNAAVPGSDLGSQVERVRVTPHAVNLDEMSKLWMTFQSQYRISAVYQASVVLIDSSHEARAPVPVLMRGGGDTGVQSQADLTPPFPTIVAVAPPGSQPSARLGDTLTLTGFHLDGDTVLARFASSRLAGAIDVSPVAGGTATRLAVPLPDDPAGWPAGLWTVEVVVRRAGQPERVTGELPFALSPAITSALPMAVQRDAGGTATMTLTCSPEVRPGQRAALLIGGRAVLAQPHPNQTDTLTFSIGDADAGDFSIRLRIDGVDSLLVADYGARPPAFDQKQRVTIT
jgi:hypothetical protein